MKRTFPEKKNQNIRVVIVAPHERQHYIFIRFWKVPTEAAILFAGSRLAPPKIGYSLGLFVSRDCTLLY